MNDDDTPTEACLACSAGAHRACSRARCGCDHAAHAPAGEQNYAPARRDPFRGAPRLAEGDRTVFDEHGAEHLGERRAAGWPGTSPGTTTTRRT